jgi:ElaB/YqjD/DUF883 family membrane-anchored ribosome-binding protein
MVGVGNNRVKQMSETPNRQKAGELGSAPVSLSNKQSPTATFGQTVRKQAESFSNNVGDALDRGTSDLADSASAARDSFAEDLSNLRADLARMQETVSRFASEASSNATRTVRDVGQAVASEVGSAASELAEAGSEMASSAKEQVKTVASGLEGMARKNPLGTLAASLLVGVIIGMMSRRRRT